MDPILHPASDQVLPHHNGSEKGEDLLLFHEMQKLQVTGYDSISPHTVEASAVENVAHEDIFSSSEWDKNDYGWLMTPPATPFIPSMDKGLECDGLSIDGTSTAPGSEAKSEPTVRSEPSSKVVRGDLGFKQPGRSSGYLLSSVDTNLHSFASSPNIALRQSSSYSLSGSSSVHASRPSARPSTPTRSQSLVRPSTPTRSSHHPTQPSTPTLTRSIGGLQPSPRPSTPNRLNVSSQSSPRPSTPNRLNVSSQPSPRPSTPNRLNVSSQPSPRPSTPNRLNVPSQPSPRPSTPNRLHGSSQPSPRPSTTIRSSIGQASPRSSTPNRSNGSFQPVRSSTPTNTSARTSTPTRSSGTPRASTPSNSSIRPSTPTSRSTVPSAWPASSIRSSTPVKRPSTPTGSSTPQNTTSRSSSASKANSVTAKVGGPCRPSSPASRTRQPGSHPAAPSFSQDPPPNLRTSTGDRYPSNPRASLASRSTASATKALPSDTVPQNRRTSCSPVPNRGRFQTSCSPSGDNNSRNSKVVDDGSGTPLSSGTISNKMVDKTTSSKVFPSSQDRLSSTTNMQVKTSVKTQTTRDIKPSKESSGFGRSLSKKSLDMALRHMDIRSSAPAGFRTFMSNVPTSSLYSVRSGNSRGNSAVDSPMATSSNASSDFSMTIGVEPEGSDPGDETFTKNDIKISSNIADPLSSFSNDRNTNGWLSCNDFIEDNNTDIMQIFEQGRLSSSESPLISHEGGSILCDDFSLDSIQHV